MYIKVLHFHMHLYNSLGTNILSNEKNYHCVQTLSEILRVVYSNILFDAISQIWYTFLQVICCRVQRVSQDLQKNRYLTWVGSVIMLTGKVLLQNIYISIKIQESLLKVSTEYCLLTQCSVIGDSGGRRNGFIVLLQ